MLNRRIISAAALVILLFAAVIFSADIFFAVVCILAVIGMHEYFKAIGSGSVKPMKIIGTVSGLVLIFLMYNINNFYLIIPLITFTVLILMSVPVIFNKYNFQSAGATIIGILYVPMLFGYIYLIRSMPGNGVYLIWFVFITAWFTDTFAYFTGMLIGKTKLCPSISPKKTVEGSIGGILGSMAGCSIYGLILSNYLGIHIPLQHLAIIGFAASVISQIGDLAASSIKRNVGIKDYGKIMPGHGGVLDRFDSILFVSPIIYYYITYILY